jgi:hypothetical protein
MITRSIGRSQSASSAGEQAFGVGLVDEHVQPAAGPAQDVAGDERRVLANQEDDLLRLAVEFDASTPRGSSSIVAGLGRRRYSARGGTHTDAPYARRPPRFLGSVPVV